jgi:hypothetical protein
MMMSASLPGRSEPTLCSMPFAIAPSISANPTRPGSRIGGRFSPREPARVDAGALYGHHRAHSRTCRRTSWSYVHARSADAEIRQRWIGGVP